MTADLRRRYRRRRSMVLLSAILVVLLVLHVFVQDGRLSTVVSTVRHAVTSVWRGSSPSGSKAASSAVESDSTDSDAADSDAGSSIAKASSVPDATSTKNLTAGLTTSLDSIFSGATYAVDVIDMSTGGTVVGIDTGTRYTSASTYKLFVAYSMISAVESGEKTWDSELNGQTLRSCVATMIVDSDNDCPVAWLEEQGYGEVNQQVHDAGFDDTTIENQNMSTTASDLADYLTRLHQGSFMDADSRSMLLGYMKTQVYRSGVPTGIGSNGTAADKVGFLDGLLHDASIIYTTKGDYVMVVLADGSSWASIAQAASTIYAAL